MTEKNERRCKPVFVDFAALKASREDQLGRPLTPQEEAIIGEADAISIDAMACGRSIKTTVDNIERYGGTVSDAVKAYLGLIRGVN